VSEPRSLVELVIDLNDRLEAASVGHGFGGAIALAYCVHEPRATRDVDINIHVPVSHAASVFELLPAGVAWGKAHVHTCRERGQIRLWYRRERFEAPLDLFFPQHAFHEAVAAATRPRPFATEDYRIPVIAAAHLCVFKALFNRPKDWVDIAAMLAAGTVDLAEAERWLVTLLGADHETSRRFLQAVADSGNYARLLPGAEMELPPIDWQGLGS
jgi:pimeloyl-ACP methyl ester carboxylesterase